MKTLGGWTYGAILALVAIGTGSTALAVPTLSVDFVSGNHAVTVSLDCSDEDPGCDTIRGASGAGLVNWSLSIPTVGGQVAVSVTGATKPLPGYTGLAHMNLWFDVSGLHDGDYIALFFSETGFATTFYGINGHIDGTTSNTSRDARAFFDESNTLFGMGGFIGSRDSDADGPFDEGFVGAGPTLGPYSLSMMFAVRTGFGAGIGNASGNFELTQVPEPASVVLLSSVALIAALALRRKFSP